MSATAPSKEQQAQPFYAAIGRAVTNWQLVEDAVGMLFAHLMSPTNVPSKISAQAAYYSVIGSRARLALVDAAAMMQWRGPRFAKWRTLKKNIEHYSEFRNHLAHFSLHELPSADGELHLCLRPTVFDVRYVPYVNPPKPKPREYDHKDILDTSDKFLRLYKELVKFGIETGAILPPPESP